MTFPDNFLFGFGTSAYQIEGGASEDGREPSIWDTFCRLPGKVRDGSSGDTACDHYHRYREDVSLLHDLNAGAYLFSISWPRVMSGNRPNPAGLDFYSRLTDELLSKGIRPFAKLYHWDLPERIQQEGGWENRDTARRFADYADRVTRVLGDRIKDWISCNEPWCVTFLGMYLGEFAPGSGDLPATLAASHHLLLSHGLAADPVRLNGGRECRYGIAPNYIPVYPAGDSAEDRAAAERFDGYFNRWFLDPVFGRGYPGDMVAYYGDSMPAIGDGDMGTIAVPLDFLGVNYYNALTVRDNPGGKVPETMIVPMEGAARSADREIYPPGLYDTLTRIYRDYAPAAVFVTENGAAFEDPEPRNGRIDDRRRAAFLQDHLKEAFRAMNGGVPLKGYFVWTLLDNFEWTAGYTLKYGVVHVDFQTQKRTVKDSGLRLRELFRSKRLE